MRFAIGFVLVLATVISVQTQLVVPQIKDINSLISLLPLTQVTDHFCFVLYYYSETISGIDKSTEEYSSTAEWNSFAERYSSANLKNSSNLTHTNW